MFFKRKKADSANDELQLAESRAESMIMDRNNSIKAFSRGEPKNEKAKTTAKRKYKHYSKRLTAKEREILKRLDNIEKILLSLAMASSTHQLLVFSYLMDNDEERKSWMRAIIKRHEEYCR